MDFNTHFQLHLESLRPPHKPSTPHVKAYASEAGKCNRRLYYRLKDSLHTGSEDEPAKPSSTIAFHIGNNLHDEYQEMMRTLFPHNFTSEVKWVYPNKENPIVSGRCDGTYVNDSGIKIALEIKTHSKWSYNKALENGQPFSDEALQAAMSCVLLGCDMVQIVYINKEYAAEHEPLTIWTYPVSEEVVTNEIARMASILKIAHNGHLPDRIVLGQPITDPERDSRCNWCPYLDRCGLDGPEPPLTRRKPSTRRT